MPIRFLLCLILLCSTVFSTTAMAKTAQKAQLELASGSALVVDLENGRVLYSNNTQRVMPIASVSKLMTAMVVLDAKQPMQEVLEINISENQDMLGVFSRVKIGSQITREKMLLLALMSSENRAATSLAHHYPGGTRAFVAAMNAKAKTLQMKNSHFVEPTGLSIYNTSNAEDLIRLIKAAYRYPQIRRMTTTATDDTRFKHPNYARSFFNTNPLVRSDKWDIRLSKTGYTDKAGHCLTMVTLLNGRPVAIALLDSFGKRTHLGDASRIRKWLETGQVVPVPAVALQYKAQKQQANQ